ncbi:MAG: valine--tRNA ligase [Acholeplasmatales bacterium]|nr:valine--tRNA ligase [Acholeplasmatales bacterium]
MLEKKYNFQNEDEIYDYWVNNGYFKAGRGRKKPYTIVIPPPNVTGALHLGHALDNTLQDIIIRRKRMQGYDALYLPGMDHAGIATEAKVDEKLRKEGLSRSQVSRETFLKEAWQWKTDHASIIHKQWRALGLSVDYDKERFTLDQGLSAAVNKVFTSFYQKGLIYRGYKIINWDVKAKTALSNIEVEHQEVDTFLYYLRYPLVNPLATEKSYVVVATTRPETCFADQALMVNPHDHRYTNLVGREVIIPTTKIVIPIISDDYVDPKFASGIVKVTPAHDPNDFEVGLRHHLASPLCMEEDGTMNSLAGKYASLERFAARKQLLEDLDQLGLVDHIDPYQTSIGYSERTGVVVESRLSLQWFLKMDELAKRSLATKTQFVPERFKKIFVNWMKNPIDWCISRQLWWGHRIPAWYYEDQMVVSDHSPGPLWKQDEDVLDTWFSSGLWPFSTLGWPNVEDPLFKRYFPTNTLVTGYDIIFFWVARMIFMSEEFTNQRPFKHVLIHGIIRDTQGRKMTKSLGNGIDPLLIKKEYGIDSLRLFVSTNSTPGADFRFDMTKVESSWNFINKLYNIARYIQMNTDDLPSKKFQVLNAGDEYVLARYQETVKLVNRLYEHFEFGEVNRYLATFIWDDFASWYLEYSKVTLNIEATSRNTKIILRYLLENILKLLHPLIPFVTESIYLEVYQKGSIMVSTWPQTPHQFGNKANFEAMQAIIVAVRNLRQTKNIAYTKQLHMVIKTTNEQIKSEALYLQKALGAQPLEFNSMINEQDYLAITFNEGVIYILASQIIDKEASLQALNQQKVYLEGELARSEKILNNANFLAKATSTKVQEERDKYQKYLAQYQVLLTHLKEEL